MRKRAGGRTVRCVLDYAEEEEEQWEVAEEGGGTCDKTSDMRAPSSLMLNEKAPCSVRTDQSIALGDSAAASCPASVVKLVKTCVHEHALKHSYMHLIPRILESPRGGS